MNGVSPVRLKYATSQSFTVDGVSPAYTALTVKVRNIAFMKDVSIHLRGFDGVWQDQPLSWLGNYGDYDLFQRSAAYTEQFVIRYTVNGITYWDNNNGFNYHLTNLTNTVGGNVVLNKATAKIGFQAGGGFTFRTSWVEGEIYVNNLSFAKKVGIRLSANGGINWYDTDASYVGNATDFTYAGAWGAEVWRFKTPELNYNVASSIFRFAVYYNNVSTGQWFWDNNFGQDYSLDKTDGTTIQ